MMRVGCGENIIFNIVKGNFVIISFALCFLNGVARAGNLYEILREGVVYGYLYGTDHSFISNKISIHDFLLKNSKTICVEKIANDIEFMNETTSGFNNGDDDLDDLLRSNGIKLLRGNLNAYGKQELVLLVLGLRKNKPDSISEEDVLIRRAIANNIGYCELESYKTRQDDLQKMGSDSVSEMLRLSIEIARNNSDEYWRRVGRVSDAIEKEKEIEYLYYDANPDSIVRKFFELVKVNALIRNETMYSKIYKTLSLESRPTFTVGYFHINGNGGLRERLVRDGYNLVDVFP